MSGRPRPTLLATVLAAFVAACGSAASGQAGSTTAGADVAPSGSESGTPTAEKVRPDAGAAQESRPGVAVFPLVNGGSYGEDAEDLQALRVGLQQMLLTELEQNDELRIVERSMLKQIMDEQDLGASGRVDPRTAAKIGELVGARYMISGVFADVYGHFRMDARIIDAETGEILETASTQGDREDLYGLLVDLAGQITRKADLPPLPTAVREERRSREISSQAVTLYSRAQVYQDRGRTERAVQLYQRIVDEFPEMTEARRALEQIKGEGS